MDTDTALKLSKVRSLTDSGAARSIRLAARLSLQEVAEAVGAHVTTVYRWEVGQRRPHGDAAVRYGEFLLELLESS